ncbi:MAG: recombinase family protein [Candidatus Dormibacteraeota bacterium]|nr:recombinase family protein [Candidatus Dormibacteraeota bacterium]
MDADPNAIRELRRPLVRVSATYISGGAPWDQRGDLREIIELARAGRVQAVMTPNLDRVARNVEVAHRFLRELVSAGVRTLFEGCVPYDLVDDNQQFIYGIRAEFSAFERTHIVRRMFGGKVRAAREGFYVGGGLPFGTALEATSEPGKARRARVVAHAAELEVVLALFNRRLQGIGVPELAAWTRELGVMPRIPNPKTPGPGLTLAQIYRILRNDFYVTGELAFHATQPGSPVEVIRQRVPLPRPVDREVFDQLAVMRRQRSGQRAAAGSYLLAGRVYHRTSGTPFTSSSTKTAARRYRYYRNPAWAAAMRRLRAEKVAVDGPYRRRLRPVRASLKKDELEGVVLAQLVRAARERRLLRRMLKMDRANEDAARAAYGRKQKKLQQAEAAADRLLDAFASGALPMTEATTRKYREIASRVACLTIDAERLKTNLARAHGQEREVQIQEALRGLPGRLQEATPGQRRALLAGLVSRIWIDDDGSVSISLRGTDPCS